MAKTTKRKTTKRKATKRKKPSVVDTLNGLRARELSVIVQYMRHHYLVTGVDGMAVADEFKETAITEMEHAEELAERIDFLGGNPTTKPTPISTKEKTFSAMARADLAAENDAVKLYKAAITEVAKTDDTTTRRLLEGILADEEDHVDTFSKMLGK